MKTKHCVYCGKRDIDIWTGHVIDEESGEWLTAGWRSESCIKEMKDFLPKIRYERQVKNPSIGCYGYYEEYMGKVGDNEYHVTPILPPELFEF